MSLPAIHIIEDFLETLENVPDDIKPLWTKITNLQTQIQDLRHTLYRKRLVILKDASRSTESSIVDPNKDETRNNQGAPNTPNTKPPLEGDVKQALLKRVERDHSKLVSLIDTKLSLLQQLYSLLHGHLLRFQEAMTAQNEFVLESNFPGSSGQQEEERAMEELLTNPALEEPFESLINISPKKRQDLQQNGLSSNNTGEVTFCTCRRVAFGVMLPCANKKCPYEWFHMECIVPQELPLTLHSPTKKTKSLTTNFLVMEQSWTCSSCKKEQHSNLIKSPSKHDDSNKNMEIIAEEEIPGVVNERMRRLLIDEQDDG